MITETELNHLKERLVRYRKQADDLAAEKYHAIMVITDLHSAAQLKFELMSLDTILNDQIKVYRNIIRDVNRLKRIQRDSVFDDFRRVSPIFEEIHDWEKDLGIFLGLLMKSLKRQRRALDKKPGAYVWLIGFLLRMESKVSEQDRFRSVFDEFYSNYETELALDRRFRNKLDEMLVQMKAKISLMDRVAIVLRDPELRAIVERSASGRTGDVKALRTEIDRVLEHKMGKRLVTQVFYKNAKWTVKKVTPFTIFSPVPGTNVAILTGVMLFSLGQAAKSVYVDRKAAKIARLAA